MKIYSKEYDFPEYPEKPKKIICLCFIPRSATNFLALEMRKTGRLGYPLEYFSYDHSMSMALRLPGKWPESLLRFRTSPNGVFGFKWNTSFPYSPMKPDHVIFLDREDRLAQARSYVIAKKTDIWLKIGNKNYEPTKSEIEDQLETLEMVRKDTLSLVNGHNVLRLDFNEVVRRPKGVIQRIRIFCKEV